MDNEKEISFGAFDSELMHQEIYIPEGFEATIDGDKIILKKIESEDEKIRKSLIILLQHFCKGYKVPRLEFPISYKDMLAWLEKQGEHKKFRDSIQVGDEVTRNSDGVIVNLSQLKRVAKKDEKQGEQKPIDKIQLGKKYKCVASPRYSTFMIGEIYKPEDKFLCSLMNFCSDCFEPVEDSEQKPAWSEEDEERVEEMIEYLEELYDRNRFSLDELNDKKHWLKSLRPQSHWKPSEEQLGVIEAVINNRSFQRRHLDSLYEQLKKLK